MLEALGFTNRAVRAMKLSGAALTVNGLFEDHVRHLDGHPQRICAQSVYVANTFADLMTLT